MVFKNKTQRTQTRKRKQRQSKGKQRHKQSKRLKIKQSGGLLPLPFSDFGNGTYTFFKNIGNQWYGKPQVTPPYSHDQRLMQN